MSLVILAIDNNKQRLAETANLLRAMFSNDSIITEHDPLTAIRYICNNPVDIVFVSLDMRPMDGIQFTQTVKKTRECIKVYITSGPEKLEDEFIFEDEADGFLSDPLTQQAVYRVIFG